ncbi:MAG TPA: VOC family protein [Elainellaceae cyanobacterium]
MTIRQIHHIAIICSDYDASKRFYTEILGFPIVRETYRAARKSYKLDLRVGEHDHIELFSFRDPPPRVSRPEACGLRHLAFAVDNLDQMVATLQSNGVNVEPIRTDELTGKRFTFFNDPDQLPLELYEQQAIAP